MSSIFEKIRSQEHAYKVVIGSVVATLIFVAIGIRNNAYAVSVNGEVVAIVKEKEEAASAVENLVTSVKAEKGRDVVVNETIAIEPVNTKKEEIETKEQVIEALKDAVSYKVEAYEVMVDGKTRAIVGSEQIATEILTEIAKKYAPQNGEVELDVTDMPTSQSANQSNQEAAALEQKQTELAKNATIIEVEDAKPNVEVNTKVKVGKVEVKDDTTNNEMQQDKSSKGQKIERELKNLDFNEQVEIKSIYVQANEILNEKQAMEALLANTKQVQTYELKDGDNIWDIAVEYGTTMENILHMNPQIEDETRMQIGEVINLEVPDPILSITTAEKATFKELIPAEIEYVPFSDLYIDDTKVYQQGHDGVKEISVLVHKTNDIEVSRDLISEKVLKEPKTKVVAYGTKEKPKNMVDSNTSADVSYSSEGFMNPLNGAGTISSPYGYRGSSFHKGIDIAASAGTPIYAASAGTVIYSGYNNGGYGNLIILDHGNGYQTYYAHCSSLYVRVGQTVSAGQNIAGVGNTGNSFGNHVHFEIRNDGTPINPYGYIY